MIGPTQPPSRFMPPILHLSPPGLPPQSPHQLTVLGWPPRNWPKGKNSQKKPFAEKKLKTEKSLTENDAGLQAPSRLRLGVRAR